MMVGQSISHYKLVSQLGEGGMGVVYKAEDTKLERTVALKFLAQHLLNDEEAKARFLREAKAAAALHHPNICPVYEIDDVDGKTFISMAFLKGETLEDRIAKGPLSLKDALDIARQAADGLEAAHEAAIVHRDIKPANIMVDEKGRATIMDFGLARLTEASRLTKTDAAMGTVAYMSPEQAQGMQVDSRSDLWSLGCVLYEMVSGQRPFQGQYDQALLYEICHEEPAALTGLRTGVPIELELLASKCLAKEREDRYQHASDTAVDLRTLGEKLKSGRSTILRTTPMSGAVPTPMTAGQTLNPAQSLPPDAVVVGKRRLQATHALAALATLAFLGLLAFSLTQAPPPSPPTVEFSLDVHDGLRSGQHSLSPDGRQLVMSTIPPGSLWLRPLDSVEWRELAGTDGARYPFWSPDSDEIGFFGDRRLKKVALAGGPSQTIAEAASGRSGSWGADGTILFAPASGSSQILSVPEGGGEPISVAESEEADIIARRYPHLLPDGRHFLFTQRASTPELAGVFLASLNGDLPQRLLPDVSNAIYVPREPGSGAGFLLFVREETLMAQPFDAARLELSGGPIALPAEPPRPGQADFYGFSASATGFLPHSTSGSGGQQRLVWADRDGSVVDRTDVIEQTLRMPTLSVDGERVAYSAGDLGAGFDVWAYDLSLGARTRLSDSPNANLQPIWSPDRAHVAFCSLRGGNNFDVVLAPADGSAPPAALVSTESSEVPQDWSLDGRFILYTATHPETSRDILYLERSDTGDGWEPHSFLSTTAVESQPRLSPNGRYAAYVSSESGQNEVYVQPFPDGERRTTVSTAGGVAPAWSRDGGELFYVDLDDTLVAVDVSTAGEFTINEVTSLFQQASLTSGARTDQNYDVSLDGQRFLVIEPVNADGEPVAAADSTIRVIMNWSSKFVPGQ